MVSERNRWTSNNVKTNGSLLLSQGDVEGPAHRAGPSSSRHTELHPQALLFTPGYFDPGCPPAAGAPAFWIDTSSTSKIRVAFGPISGGPCAPYARFAG